MKKLQLLNIIAIAMVMLGCKSKTGLTATEQEINVHCTGAAYQSDKNALRSSSVGMSADMMTAKNKALSMARANLATQMEATMKRVTANYVSSYQTGGDEEQKGRYDDMFREVTNQSIQGSRTICEKITKETKTGQYRAYICLEVSSESIMSAAKNRVSSDAKLRTDFEYERFKKIYEEEMEKVETN